MATLSFFLKCIDNPTLSPNGTALGSVLNAGAGLVSAAAPFTSAFSTAPSVVSSLLPSAATSLAAALTASNAGVVALGAQLACTEMAKLLQPIAKGACTEAATAMVQSAQILVALAVLFAVQQGVAFAVCCARMRVQGGGGSQQQQPGGAEGILQRTLNPARHSGRRLSSPFAPPQF